MGRVSLDAEEMEQLSVYINDEFDGIDMYPGLIDPTVLARAAEEVKALNAAGGAGTISAASAGIAADVIGWFQETFEGKMNAAELATVGTLRSKLSAAIAEPEAAPVRAARRPRPALRSHPFDHPQVRITTDIRDVRFDVPGDRTIVFDSVTVERVDFSGQRFDHLVFLGSRFIDCDFSRARFAPYNCGFASQSTSSMNNCRFDKAAMSSFRVNYGRFVGCSFRGTKIKNWRSECAEFLDCTFATRIESSIFYGRPDQCHRMDDLAKKVRAPMVPRVDRLNARLRARLPRRSVNEFRENDFSESDFDYVDLRSGIDVGANRWPEREGYRRLDRWPERLARAHATVKAWEQSNVRKDAMNLLEVMSSGGSEEQDEVILTARSFTGYYDREGAGQRLREVLESS